MQRNQYESDMVCAQRRRADSKRSSFICSADGIFLALCAGTSDRCDDEQLRNDDVHPAEAKATADIENAAGWASRRATICRFVCTVSRLRRSAPLHKGRRNHLSWSAVRLPCAEAAPG